MSQRVTRIHIVVKNKADWEKLYGIDWLEDYGLIGTGEDIFGECDKHFVCDELACDDIESFMYDIIDCLPQACLMISDSTDLNVDPYTNTFYYLGGEFLEGRFFDEDTHPELCDMFHKTNINDIKGWFEYGQLLLNEEEVEYMKEFL